MNFETQNTDILIIGSGGAGLFAALHAMKSNPENKITIAVTKMEAWTTAKSLCIIESIINLPIPGHPNIVSTITAPLAIAAA